jgi:ABC-type multidrug transport system permease subunit
MAVCAIAAKEWTVMFRDRTIVAAVLVQPLLLTIVFGIAVRSEVHDAHWIVFDADRTATSRRLVDELAATYELGAPVRVASYAATELALRRQEGAAALIIPHDFTRALLRSEPADTELLENGADPLVAVRVAAVVRGVTARFRADEDRRAGEDRIVLAGTPDVDVRRRAMGVRSTMLFNPKLTDSVFFVPTLPAIFFTQLFFGLACFSIVGERERGTYEHVLALPLRPRVVLFGKALPYVAVAGGWLVAYYGLVARAFDVGVRGSAGVIALATGMFLAASYAIAVLFSAVARNTHQAVYLTVFSVLPSSVISGFMVTTSTMPRPIQLVALALPTTHYVTILRAVVVRGARLADVAAPLAAMAAILAVVAAGLWAWYPRRLDR